MTLVSKVDEKDTSLGSQITKGAVPLAWPYWEQPDYDNDSDLIHQANRAAANWNTLQALTMNGNNWTDREGKGPWQYQKVAGGVPEGTGELSEPLIRRVTGSAGAVAGGYPEVPEKYPEDSWIETPCVVPCIRWSTTIKVLPQSTNSNEQLSRHGRNSASRSWIPILSWTRALANGVVVLTPWCSRMADILNTCSNNI